ncbi:hypothetical protein D3C85_1016400 [compost metagenome]
MTFGCLDPFKRKMNDGVDRLLLLIHNPQFIHSHPDVIVQLQIIFCLLRQIL